jgi:hypothetical protein
VLTLGLSAARSSPVGAAAAGRRVAALTGGDLSETSLKAMVDAMDPAVAAVGRRFDPAEPQPQGPEAGDLTGYLPGQSALASQYVEGEAARRLNEAIPFVKQGVYPAAPFVLKARSPAERQQAVRCLTNAIYYEAALEPVEGRRAVAQVVLNRVRDPHFPNSICQVVYQGWERFTGCQFSFTCDGALVRAPVAVLWDEDRKIAEAALNGYVTAAVGTATHYHADYVAPYWAPELVKISQIGRHIFYRWPGASGEPGAFTAAYAGHELAISNAVLTGKAARAAPPQPVKAVDLPDVRTMTVADADGTVRTRVQATLQPALYGRRQPTPEEIAAINAKLEALFPSKAPSAAPLPMAADVAQNTLVLRQAQDEGD